MPRLPTTSLPLALLVLGVPFLSLGAQGGTRPGAPNEALARAVREVEQLDALRSSLARTFASGGVAATDSTFAQVCKPVKAQAMKVASENGWVVAQLAERNRHPDNALDGGARRAFMQMRRNPDVMGEWVRASLKGRQGTRYFRRITVEPACLACHGKRDARPDFVKKNYPNDKAFGFAAGDLRGIYSIFIPDATPAR
ncbi:MAG TPA: DUF3365 domain-containing protein [Gemmatimonadaceae bacterium]|nr:MAG: hypothetical protein ABS52_01420 [Gemmatimonadetes bacterium SCN 70-22]HMN09829.1 DUF3365 domain-containing protein [Gemmatimonadaceae bacterium]